MAVTVDQAAARRRLNEALAIAKSPSELPAEWLERTERVGQSATRTQVAVLGTALLAKATNRKIDPLSLKATADSPGAYGPRMLCHAVVVPFSVEHAIHLGARGPEPLNNMPWFRYDFVSTDMRVRNRESLEYLIVCLERINDLSEAEALQALAAFLRVRARAEVATRRLVLRARPPLEAVIEAATVFATEDAEGGRRGQALVAAALDLTFADVRTSRINDPSRHFPGDVHIYEEDETPIMAVEVRQKAVSENDVLLFAQRLERLDVERAEFAALGADQGHLPDAQLAEEIVKRYGVNLTVVEGVAALVHQALNATSLAVPAALERFTKQVVVRLQELEAAAASVDRWADLVGGDVSK